MLHVMKQACRILEACIIYHSSNFLAFHNLIYYYLEMSALETEIRLVYSHDFSSKISF